MRENADQKNSEYEHFLRSEILCYFHVLPYSYNNYLIAHAVCHLDTTLTFAFTFVLT